MIHHIGTEYAVSIRKAEDPVKNSLYNIMKLALCTAGRHLYRRGAPPGMANTHVINEANTGIREADAAYAIVPMMPENARFFREIPEKDGKPRTITVDVTYTISRPCNPSDCHIFRTPSNKKKLRKLLRSFFVMFNIL